MRSTSNYDGSYEPATTQRKPLDPPGDSRSAPAAFVFAVVFVLAIYACIARGTSGGDLTRERASDYYGELTDAFLSGHTYLEHAPDPALKMLADPFVDAPWVPRLHDASYFNGRYYLYFGAGPVVTLLAPWHLLMGSYLAERAAVTIFVNVGFVFGAFLLWRAWRRWCGNLSPLWMAGAVILWGLGSHSAILMATPGVYGVPITFAHACIMGAILAAWLAISARTNPALLGWLAASALIWGSALSGRPNYLFGLVALVWPARHLFRAHHDHFGSPRRFALEIALAIGLPLLAVGFALAYYNWVRFGSVTEFGSHWQFAGSDQRRLKLFELAHILPNARAYLFSFPHLSPYFPFTPTLDAGCGVLGCLTFAVLAIAFPVTLLGKSFRRDPVWITLGLTLLTALLLNFFSVSGVPWANERYATDFVPLATLLAAITAGRILDWSQSRRLAKWAFGLSFTLLGVWTLAFAALFIVSRHPRRAGLGAVESPALRLAAAVEKLRDIGHGPLHLQMRLSPRTPGTRLPLVVSGGGRDILFVELLESQRIQFGFVHLGNTPVIGEPIILNGESSRQLMIDLGSLYPPPLHPSMTKFSATELEMLARTVTVRLDGREVLHTSSIFYPTHPDDIQIGRNPGGLITKEKFLGTLSVSSERVLPQPGTLAAQSLAGPLRLTLTLPPFSVFRIEPLVSAGPKNSGDLFYVSYVGPDRVRFGHDSHGGGAVETEAIAYNSAQQHELEIDMGSLHANGDSHARYAPLVIRFDGMTLYDDQRPFMPALPSEVVLGFNAVRSSIASEAFAGRMLRVESLSSLPPAPALNDGYGAVRLALRMPQNPIAKVEPLLTTGRTGAGDVVFVSYVDPTHLRIGLDHWGLGGPISEPLALDLRKTVGIEISLASLYPPEGDPWWARTPISEQRRIRSRFIVRLDERVVFDELRSAHPSTPAEVTGGANNIGASSCPATFSGKILSSRRAPPPGPETTDNSR